MLRTWTTGRVRSRRSGGRAVASAALAAALAFACLGGGRQAAAAEAGEEPAAPPVTVEPSAPSEPSETEAPEGAEALPFPDEGDAAPPRPGRVRPAETAPPARPSARTRQRRLADVEKRARAKLLRDFRSYYYQAIQAYRAGRFDEAVRLCEAAHEIEPESLDVSRLKYAAARKRMDYRALFEAERAYFRDEEALAEVDNETEFPEVLPELRRPDSVLREEQPRSEALRRMRERLNQAVTMNLVSADLEFVLQTLLNISGVSILADQSIVEGKILTVQVEDMPLHELLRFIEKNFDGIKFTVTENAVWVTAPAKPALVPRSYPLSRGLIGQANFSTGVRTSGGAATGSTPPGGVRPQGGGGGAAGDSHLEAVLKWMESWKDEWPEGSQWYMDRQTNTLLALTTPEMHERLEDMLDIMDTVPIQVLVRTKYIEIKAEDMTEAGLGMLFLRSSYDASDLEQTSMLQGQMSFRRAYKVSEGTQIMLDLVALQQQGRAKLLSAPEVIAMNNNSATIDISKRFSYASQYSAASSLIQNPGGGTTQIPAAYMPSQFVDVDVGFLLEFVPSVGRDMKHIVLDLHSRVDDVSNIDDFSSAPFILPASGDSGSAAAAVLAAATSKGVPRPIVDSREFRTRLVVEDGGTIVIGGLLKNNRDVVNRRVPILGDIPLLGLLFRYKKESIKQSNLIIVIQAKIITPDGRTYRKETPAGTGTIGSATPDGEWILDLPPDEESGPPGYGRLPSSLPGRRATGAR